jgi:predicted amidohydrolase YtcJ
LLDKEAAFGGLDVVRTTVVDCGGMTLIPGFIDAHIHIMAYAAGLVSVDCDPQAVEDILYAPNYRAAYTRHGNWVRGAGTTSSRCETAVTRPRKISIGRSA